jgi:hypothetical protein
LQLDCNKKQNCKYLEEKRVKLKHFEHKPCHFCDTVYLLHFQTNF